MKSLQRTLGISLAAGLTFLWLIASLVSGLVVSHELNEAADSALRVTAQQLLAITENAPVLNTSVDTPADTSVDSSRLNNDASTSASGAATRAPQGGEEVGPTQLHYLAEISSLLGFVIRDSEGTVLFSGGTLPDSLLEAMPAAGFGMIQGHRVYVESSAGQQRWVLIAEPSDHRREVKHGAIRVLLMILPLLVPLSLLLVWWIVRVSMRPVSEVQMQIETRGGNDLTPMQTAGMPLELAPIAESVNHLLARLERTLESERNFTTNSAHELRTPIASALAQIQRQIASLPDGPEQVRARRIEQTLHELSRTSEKLMQLARAESGSMVRDKPDNVYPVIEYLLSEFNSLHREESRLQLHCVNDARFDTRLDFDGVAILLRNLIDNALKYSKSGTAVDLVVNSDTNCISVINQGNVVPADELAHLKERFKRGSGGQGSGAAGAGLGLAIADTIARQSGIIIELYSPARGQVDGFEATLSTE